MKSVITLHLSVESKSGDHDIEVDFDTDLKKPIRARTYSPSLDQFFDCTEVFLQLYKGPEGSMELGYWKALVLESFQMYQNQILQDRIEAWVDERNNEE